jgi:hypothetical protein
VPKRQYAKLTKRQRRLASKYISEEMKVKKRGRRKYKPKQAIAIGLSRARAATKKKAKRPTKEHRVK